MVSFTALRLSTKSISTRLSVNKTTQGLKQHHPRRKEENNSFILKVDEGVSLDAEGFLLV